LVWVKFIFCILIIFFSGRKIARYGDIIAEKTGLGGIWIGLILLALITSLPELFNGVSAVIIVDAPDLTVGNLLGANAFNMLNLALLDIACQNGSLLAVASRTHRLTAWLSLLMVLLVAVSVFISSRFHALGIGWIGWYTPAIIIFYLVFMRVIYFFEQRQPFSQETGLKKYEAKSTGRVYLHFAIWGAIIIGAGIWLAIIGDEIDFIYGWGESFVGSLLLAFTTTLPEMTVSFTAMRMGARDMAIANMLGSNLFNMAIIPVDDLLYLKSPILVAVSENHLITAFAVMVMTLLFIAGLRFKPERLFRLSWCSLALIGLFLLTAYFSFTQPGLGFLFQ